MAEEQNQHGQKRPRTKSCLGSPLVRGFADQLFGPAASSSPRQDSPDADALPSHRDRMPEIGPQEQESSQTSKSPLWKLFQDLRETTRIGKTGRIEFGAYCLVPHYDPIANKSCPCPNPTDCWRTKDSYSQLQRHLTKYHGMTKEQWERVGKAWRKGQTCWLDEFVRTGKVEGITVGEPERQQKQAGSLNYLRGPHQVSRSSSKSSFSFIYCHRSLILMVSNLRNRTKSIFNLSIHQVLLKIRPGKRHATPERSGRIVRRRFCLSSTPSPPAAKFIWR